MTKISFNSAEANIAVMEGVAVSTRLLAFGREMIRTAEAAIPSPSP